jgi:hypothetical protein
MKNRTGWRGKHGRRGTRSSDPERKEIELALAKCN